MQSTTHEAWLDWRRAGCRRLPAARTFHGETLPGSWEGFADRPASVLLESGLAGRFTYLCDRPDRVIIGQPDSAELRSPDGLTCLERRVGAPLEILEALRKEARAPELLGWPAMAGGLLGVFGYDLVRTWETLPLHAVRDLSLPLYALIETGELFVYDHANQTLGIVVWVDAAGLAEHDLARAHAIAQQRVSEAHARWRAAGAREWNPKGMAVVAEPPSDPFTRETFEDAVRKVKSYLAAGHTYQVNLSLRTSRPAPAPAETLYEAVRRVNPSPYMGLLRLPGFALVCGSPELLVKMSEGRVVSRPIAGTRPRGANAAGDHDLSTELIASEKERAEHLMLVDLIRNDIGRVAESGSVNVREFMAVERYSHVMHLVSEVEGTLASGKTWGEVLRAMFPGGTITGCPKFRTMEIIEELEPVGRGFYTGSLGWISYRGDMEMNIIIRSMLVQDGIAHVQAGAGIVADSQPEREFDEAMQKARALWVAWQMAAPHD